MVNILKYFVCYIFWKRQVIINLKFLEDKFTKLKYLIINKRYLKKKKEKSNLKMKERKVSILKIYIFKFDKEIKIFSIKMNLNSSNAYF